MSEELSVEKTLGQWLQQTREAKKWTIPEVADRMHILQDRIRELENDEFTKSPAIAYTRGYLQSYARLLELPLDDVLKRYDSLNLKSPETFSAAPGRIYFSAARVNSGHPIMRWATILVVLALLSLVVIWVKNNYLSQETIEDYSEAPLAPVLMEATANTDAEVDAIMITNDDGTITVFDGDANAEGG